VNHVTWAMHASVHGSKPFRSLRVECITSRMKTRVESSGGGRRAWSYVLEWVRGSLGHDSGKTNVEKPLKCRPVAGCVLKVDLVKNGKMKAGERDGGEGGGGCGIMWVGGGGGGGLTGEGEWGGGRGGGGGARGGEGGGGGGGFLHSLPFPLEKRKRLLAESNRTRTARSTTKLAFSAKYCVSGVGFK